MALRAGIRANKSDLKALKKKIKELNQFTWEGKKILLHEAERTAARIKRDAPVDTGRLRREVDVEKVTNDDIIITSVAIDPESRVDYAPFQEYGTRKIRPRPYFYRNIRLMIKDLHKRLSIKLEKLARRR